jgi:hypothetical protein
LLTWPATYAARVTQDQRRSVWHKWSRVTRHIVRHPRAALLVFTLVAALTLVATFVPWLRSGTATRSSYDMLGLLTRLELANGGLVRTMVRWWPVVPLLITSSVVAAWWQRARVALAAAIGSGLYAGGVGVAVLVKTRGTSIEVGPGPWFCVISSAGLLITAVWLALTNARRLGPAARAATTPDGRS